MYNTMKNRCNFVKEMLYKSHYLSFFFFKDDLLLYHLLFSWKLKNFHIMVSKIETFSLQRTFKRFSFWTWISWIQRSIKSHKFQEACFIFSKKKHFIHVWILTKYATWCKIIFFLKKKNSIKIDHQSKDFFFILFFAKLHQFKLSSWLVQFIVRILAFTVIHNTPIVLEG